MANRYYGLEFGSSTTTAVTEGSSTTAGLDVEIRITYDATGASKIGVLQLIELLEAKIVSEPWPLA